MILWPSYEQRADNDMSKTGLCTHVKCLADRLRRAVQNGSTWEAALAQEEQLAPTDPPRSSRLAGMAGSYPLSPAVRERLAHDERTAEEERLEELDRHARRIRQLDPGGAERRLREFTRTDSERLQELRSDSYVREARALEHQLDHRLLARKWSAYSVEVTEFWDRLDAAMGYPAGEERRRLEAQLDEYLADPRT